MNNLKKWVFFPVKFDALNTTTRLDRWLTRQYPYAPYVFWQKAIRTGDIRIGHELTKTSCDFSLNDKQTVSMTQWCIDKLHTMKEEFETNTLEQRTQSKGSWLHKGEKAHAWLKEFTIYEDDAILVVNKPADFSCQGGSGLSSERALDRWSSYGVLYRKYLEDPENFIYTDITHEPIMKMVHRIDAATSGIVILAKTSEYAMVLSNNWTRFEKNYQGLVYGFIPKDYGEWNDDLYDLPCGTIYEVAERFRFKSDKSAKNDFYTVTLMNFTLKTGRKHQIRQHALMHEHPLVGDYKYASRDVEENNYNERKYGLCLTHNRMTIYHPKTNQKMTFEIPHPPKWFDILNQFHME